MYPIIPKSKPALEYELYKLSRELRRLNNLLEEIRREGLVIRIEEKR